MRRQVLGQFVSNNRRPIRILVTIDHLAIGANPAIGIAGQSRIPGSSFPVRFRPQIGDHLIDVDRFGAGGAVGNEFIKRRVNVGPAK